jgi:hypothetical protein
MNFKKRLVYEYFNSYEFERTYYKVKFFNNCNLILRLLYSLVHGRNFRPTIRERDLVYLYDNYEKLKTTNFYATKPLSSQREESTKLHKRTL